MNHPLPEDHPQARWLWPWPPQPTRDFLARLSAQPDFKSGPGADQSTLVFRIFLTAETEDGHARETLRRLAAAWGYPELPPESLLDVRTRPIRLNPIAPAYIEVPVAVLPTQAAAEYANQVGSAAEALPPPPTKTRRSPPWPTPWKSP